MASMRRKTGVRDTQGYVWRMLLHKRQLSTRSTGWPSVGCELKASHTMKDLQRALALSPHFCCSDQFEKFVIIRDFLEFESHDYLLTTWCTIWADRVISPLRYLSRVLCLPLCS